MGPQGDRPDCPRPTSSRGTGLPKTRSGQDHAPHPAQDRPETDVGKPRRHVHARRSDGGRRPGEETVRIRNPMAKSDDRTALRGPGRRPHHVSQAHRGGPRPYRGHPERRQARLHQGLKAQAMAAAAASDALRRRARALASGGHSVLDKNLCDVAGETTHAARRRSMMRRRPRGGCARGGTPARGGGSDRGQHQLSEFAFSGVGFNPHYGTPGNPRIASACPAAPRRARPYRVADRMAPLRRWAPTQAARCASPAASAASWASSRRHGACRSTASCRCSTSLDIDRPSRHSVEDCAIVRCVFSAEPIRVPEALTAQRSAACGAKALRDGRSHAVVAKAFERALTRWPPRESISTTSTCRS